VDRPVPPKVPGGRSFRFPTDVALAPDAAEATAPFSLTASDGTGLTLVAVDAHGVLEPPLAFTELHLTFENPRDRVIEGRFRVALPPGAALSRFAMKLDTGWQEGEVVERQAARRAYEDFLHRRQDPALLEQEAANEFSARVFPIPARGRKEIVVSWSHALVRGDEPYVLPLLGLPEVGALDVQVLLGERPAGALAASNQSDEPTASRDVADRARVSDAGSGSNLGGEVSDRRFVELHKQGWTPDRDLVIAQREVSPRAGLRHGNLAVVRVTALVEPRPQEVAGLYVLVDSSASRALGYAHQVRKVGELLAGLRAGAGAATPVAVAAFDQEVVPLFAGTAGDFGDRALAALRTRRPLGASDLEGALRWLDGELREARGRYPRVLLVTDGVATAGDTETATLRAAVRALGAHGVERVDVLAFGGLRDEAVLRELLTGNLPADGARLDGNAPASEIGRRLTLACRSGIAVSIDGASWVWPERLDGAQPGDEALVYADLPAERPLHLTVDGRTVEPGGGLVEAERPLLQRAWAQARIERLLHLRDTTATGDEDLRRALTLQVTQLSVEHRVLSPYTALLVLETEADYARFGLERRALADVLTVGAGGLEVLARSLPPTTTAPADAAAKLAATERLARRALGDAGSNAATPVGQEGEREDDAPASRVAGLAQPATVEGRLEAADDESFRGNDAIALDGVAGGIEGGVAGGVAGGVPGGVVASAPEPSPPPAPPTEVAEELTVTGESALADNRARDRELRPLQQAPRPAPEAAQADKASRVAAYDGRFGEVMAKLASGKVAGARALAESWSEEAPGDVLALIALGEAWEAAGEKAAAARAYGSLIDLFPSRADLRRLAGERLERCGGDAALALAIDTYTKAVAQRPDHPSSHRLLAWALVRAGRHAEAFAALEAGLTQSYPAGRFAGVERVLREDLGILATAWLAAEPARRGEVAERLRARGARLDREPSIRFVLSWETDANDVDLHIYDRQGNHAYYQAPALPTGGLLFADVTTGYGPECFAVPAPAKAAAPYRINVHYYSRGPMGYGMGTVQVVTHDGRGDVRIDPRPFVVMTDQAMVDLGRVPAAGVAIAAK
jgi:tetratricopeptide (TPR) repeat protein